MKNIYIYIYIPSESATFTLDLLINLTVCMHRSEGNQSQDLILADLSYNIFNNGYDSEIYI